MNFEAGEAIRIRWRGQQLDGVVTMVSDKAQAMMLTYFGLLTDYAGEEMAVLWDEVEGGWPRWQYRDLMFGEPVEIESLE